MSKSVSAKDFEKFFSSLDFRACGFCEFMKNFQDDERIPAAQQIK
jgi:hypothetical protein